MFLAACWWGSSPDLSSVLRHTLAQNLPWLITAFGLVWILVPHPGIELEPSLSLFLGIIPIVVGWGLRL
jgi:hypothetical protein